MKVSRLFQTLWPWKWWSFFKALGGGVRLHPSVSLYGNKKSIRLERGTKIDARSRLDVSSSGHIFSGANVWISSDVEIETDTAVYIGEGTTIQRRCTINGSTRIGAGCIFAPNVFVSSGTHPFRFIPHLPIREQESEISGSSTGLTELDRAVWIQDDCWLGVNVVVCPGVKIGKGSVIGANCVVTHDVQPYSVVAGVPGKVIGKRLNWNPGRSICFDQKEDYPYILSGKLIKAHGGDAAYIEIDQDTPLCIALAAHSSDTRLVLEWSAPRPVDFEVDGCTFRLPAGNGQREIMITPLKIFDGVRYFDVRICGSSDLAILRIAKIFTL
jgi:acetyltransferase-like isoleucine patch superfamily enzyme